MSNERYLQISYFVVLLASSGIGAGAYLFLRRSFVALTRTAEPHIGLPARRLFAFGIVVPAILGFFSVSYTSCNQDYAAVIARREYLVQVNQSQLASTMGYVVVAVILWCLIAFFILLTRPVRVASPKDERD